MNHRAVWAIYRFEMARTGRTIFQSIVSPVLSTSLYFVVFGAAIGSRIPEIEGVGYGSFIVPGLIMMTLLTQSVMNASFGIYFPRFVGTIFEILSAPVSSFEIVLGYVGAAATKSIILGLIILATAGLFVPLRIAHPVWMLAFLVLTAATFSLFGFIIGLWAEGFEKLQIIPLLILTPLTFLGGSFYSINVLPPFWQAVSLANPIVYLISVFRWSFYEVSRRQRHRERRHDRGVPRRLPRHRVVVLQDRLQDQEVTPRELRHLRPYQHQERHDRDQHRHDTGGRQARAFDQRAGHRRGQQRHRAAAAFADADGAAAVLGLDAIGNAAPSMRHWPRDQPSPTRNVPSVTDTKPPAKATNSAPISAMPTPGYITHSRPKRSDAQPSGMVKANMPAAWNEWRERNRRQPMAVMGQHQRRQHHDDRHVALPGGSWK